MDNANNNDALIMALREEVKTLSQQVSSMGSGSFAETSKTEALKRDVTALKEAVEETKAMLKSLDSAVKGKATKQDIAKAVHSATDAIIDNLTDAIVSSEEFAINKARGDVNEALGAVRHKLDQTHSMAASSAKSAEQLLRSVALQLTN